jgi:hypothetical protein
MKKYLGLPSKMQERCITLLLKLLIMLGVDSSHGLHHFFAELHGWRQGLGVAAQDVAEVDVEQRTGLGEEEVVQVAIADT